MTASEFKTRQTVFSPCRKYRYCLWREWPTFDMFEGCNEEECGSERMRQYLMVIGLNPSTADEKTDDPTIRRCIGFAKAWGFGALCMTNLFAFRATKPADMKRADNPSGEDNQHYLLQCASNAGIVLAAWGKHGSFLQQDLTVRQWMGQIAVQLHCLGRNADDSPKHPLYVPAATLPTKYP